MSLKKAATDVRHNAYAPYSNFKVGAALRGKGGGVYTGVNVENAAYPEGTCAEAGAIAAMIADGETEIAEAYVIADSPYQSLWRVPAKTGRIFGPRSQGHFGHDLGIRADRDHR